ncbi:MAG: THUMP domain-containing protein [Bdellovibrionota bacterium]
MPRFFALTSRGLGEVLEQELKEMGIANAARGFGGVTFEGPWALCYRANLRSRIATRILLPILDFPAYKPEELYANVLKHDFTKYIPPDGTIAVDASVRDCGAFRDQRFVALKIKDAIVDQFRDKYDVRPDVDTDDPDLRIVVRAVKNQFSLSIDTSGDSLFKRGYRRGHTEAHVKEHLAAGILKLTGWDGTSSVVDPMCGSGTFLIEAALMALKIAPGMLRQRFAFQRLNGFKKAEWEKEVAAAADEELQEIPFKMYGFDTDRKALAVAQANAEEAGVAEFVEFQRAPMQTLKAPAESGIMVVDPPFGERVGTKDELVDTYKDLAHVMKTSFKGWECFVLSGAPELSAAMKLKAERKFPLFHGPIECRLLKYKMF